MQSQTVRTDFPIEEPIAIYRKPFNSFLSIVLPIGVLMIILVFSNGGILGDQILFYIALIGFSIMLGLYFAWDTSHSKVERYTDAVVVYSAFQHQVFYFNDIKSITSRHVSVSRFTSYTEYTVRRRDDVTMRFNEEFQGCKELVEMLQKSIQSGQAVKL